MSQSFFAFQHFTIHQPQAAMKVGTDGVTLGAWFDVGAPSPQSPHSLLEADPSASQIEPPHRKAPERAPVATSSAPSFPRILDVGTGTGLIALMAAQRNPKAQIDAVEIDPGSCADARRNFEASAWSSRLHLIETDFTLYAQQCSLRYERIVSNPPYFVDALRAADTARSNARHTDSLTYEALLRGAQQLLTPTGSLSVILPIDKEHDFTQCGLPLGWFVRRTLRLSTKQGVAPKRILLELGRGFAVPQQAALALRTADNLHYTEEYQKLVDAFYLPQT
ncbi:MAG: methyltransferase [Alistipes sp.]|nr:methyltransferase [Alistipes sp.]